MMLLMKTFQCFFVAVKHEMTTISKIFQWFFIVAKYVCEMTTTSKDFQCFIAVKYVCEMTIISKSFQCFIAVKYVCDMTTIWKNFQCLFVVKNVDVMTIIWKTDDMIIFENFDLNVIIRYRNFIFKHLKNFEIVCFDISIKYIEKINVS